MNQIHQLSQALAEKALCEYSQRSGEQYEQDQQRQQEQSDVGSLLPLIKVRSKAELTGGGASNRPELTGAMVHEIQSKNKLELTHLSQCQKGRND